MKCSKSRRFLGLRPRPRWGSLRCSPIPHSGKGLLAIGNRGFPPPALAIFSTHIFTCEKLYNLPPLRLNPLSAYSTSIFFTSNMSHYLKSLKICLASVHLSHPGASILGGLETSQPPDFGHGVVGVAGSRGAVGGS